MKRHLILLLTLSLASAGCRPDFTPKPRGFLRVDFPDKEYVTFESDCPYSFDIPVYAKVLPDTGQFAEPCWINISFPSFDGMIHISYKPVDGDLGTFVEDTRTLTYKHTIKADAIRETVYEDSVERVYGILYDIKGDAASSLQFYLTDSNAHFLRGALYFNTTPDKDSLAPVIDFFREDIVHMMESFSWN